MRIRELLEFDLAQQGGQLLKSLATAKQGLGPKDSTPGAPRAKDKELFPLYAGPPFKPEDSSGVAVMQRNLIALGYDVGPPGADGKFGPYTQAALAAFQRDYKIDGNGSSYTKKEYDMIRKVVNNIIQRVNPSKPTISTKSATRGVNVTPINDPNFESKLEKIAKDLGVDAKDLREIIRFETAGTFSSKSHDPFGVSIGLIGFTSGTAKSLGTSKAELAEMTPVEQLDYVHRYYKMVGVRPGDDRGKIYMRTFMPAFADSPDDTVLGRKGGGNLILPSGKPIQLSMHKIWEQNPAFTQKYKKDYFTVGDVKNSIMRR